MINDNFYLSLDIEKLSLSIIFSTVMMIIDS